MCKFVQHDTAYDWADDDGEKGAYIMNLKHNQLG